VRKLRQLRESGQQLRSGRKHVLSDSKVVVARDTAVKASSWI
jgi:hypothetical protein